MTRSVPDRPSAIAVSDCLNDPQERTWPLAEFGGVSPLSPGWYRTAMAIPVEERRIDVEGAGIELLCWGELGRPGILLIHGSSAHARWWGPVAPLLAQDHRVVSFSWSGMGGSDWRDRYTVVQTAREAWAAGEAGGLFAGVERPLIVSHSFGSKAGALVAATHGASLRGAVFVDSLLLPDEKQLQPPRYRARRYDSEAAALARFRFAPDQPAGNPFIAHDIARASLRDTGDGWTWRFDPDFYPKLDPVHAWPELATAHCPLAFIRGSESTVVRDKNVATQRAHSAPGTLFIDIPDANHHVMVDQPIALVATLRALAGVWPG